MSIAPVVPAQQTPAQDTQAPEKLFDFNDELTVFRSLVTEYAAEIEATKTRRELREHRKNVAELRQQQILLPDETIVPDRTIEQNCQTEKIPYINYVEQSTNILAFHDPANPSYDFTLEQNWITSLLRYESWQFPWQEMLDSLVLHGAGFHEVVFDDSAPAKFAIEYIRRDHLLIPIGTTDINACYRLARCYELTKHQLDILAAAYDFDQTCVAQIKEHYRTRTDFIKVYKYFLRDENNVLYNAWLAEDCCSCQTWLRPPEKHFLGLLDTITVESLDAMGQPTQTARIVPRDVTAVPIFDFPYRTQEDQAILKVQGQAALSIHIQNALTGIYSGVTNGCNRAGGVYASRKTGPGQQPGDKTLYALKSGYVHDGEMSFYSLPWPNAIALSVAQALGVRSAAQTGQTDFAAMSRNDTAKRATEIIAAQEEANKIKTAQISLFSNRCLKEYRLVFDIIKSQIQAGLIQPPPSVNVEVLFSPTLTLAMAADTQVVKREQRKNQLVQFWPMVQNTQLAPVYFEHMLQELFPEEWPVWKNAMAQLQQQQQTNDSAVQVLTQIYPNLPPELQAYVDQLANPAQPMAGGPNNNPVPQQAG